MYRQITNGYGNVVLWTKRLFKNTLFIRKYKISDKLNLTGFLETPLHNLHITLLLRYCGALPKAFANTIDVGLYFKMSC